jgi:hypothetical protein
MLIMPASGCIIYNKLNQAGKMNKKLIKTAALISILIVAFAVAVTAFHHHARAHDGDNCEICSFIMVFTAAVIPAVILFFAARVFCGIISVSTTVIFFEKKSFNSSRAPPFILS